AFLKKEAISHVNRSATYIEQEKYDLYPLRNSGTVLQKKWCSNSAPSGRPERCRARRTRGPEPRDDRPSMGTLRGRVETGRHYTPAGERISKEKAGQLGRSACDHGRGRGSASWEVHQPARPDARTDCGDAVVWGCRAKPARPRSASGWASEHR